ncbi:B-cell receptor CD22-like, partial [Pagrus major]|uniref:B-cell receptor CD22-like n=1 Tax=Pagrus major TaxID=143350 RepID=UPI003CC868D0
MNGNEHVDLTTDPECSNRVEYKGVDKDCTLRITALRESDSAEYKFRFITNVEGGKYTGSPGVTLRVTEPPKVQVHRSRSTTYLKCVSSNDGHTSFIWFKNGRKIHENYRYNYPGDGGHADKYTCAVRGCEKFPSPPVYAPIRPSVSVSPSAEIVEGSSVTLTCSSDANPAATYTWYNNNQNWHIHAPSKDPKLYFSSIQSSDSRKYHCTAENELGRRTSEIISLDVKYAPKLPSVSVSPSAEIVEGSSVTLTCSSDANPVAKYTWYKEKQNLLRGQTRIYHFSPISSEDRGNYSCKSENQYGEIMSSSVSVDVQYAPKLPSVSVSPSAEIVEGSSVTLTCSSDANPAANYTWHKENEDSPKASGQIFTITDFRAEHSGNYYCEAQNRRGRNKTTVHLTVAGSGKSVAAGTITVVLLAIISLSVFLWIRKKRASRESTEAEERADDREQGQPEEQDDFQYASVHFSNNQADNLYSNI